MRDRQVEATPAQARIRVLSPLLHCIAMSVVVFLRSGFGYAYLRPKSVFFACSWVIALFTLYARIEPGMWRRYAEICIFGCASVTLYWLHLSLAYANELRGTATHDNDSGTPHTIRILDLLRLKTHPSFPTAWLIWAEPALLVAAAVGLRAYAPDWKFLSTWFLVAGYSLFFKEAINFWFHRRHHKRTVDGWNDAETNLGAAARSNLNGLPIASRKPTVRRQRIR